ncbi:hypothetical protein PFUGPA_01055 [Plasmodium falciparum Palo Alto/Uganda]|uniref:Uncharacterized protein n=3 Tax=Plasmodium falciparum TaxID=5833 RepID=W4J4S9_PLAFP|nr:hypothetical protein PFTANZ_01995 [Plasmodium falciparum Tanzania (2000708)]ETW43666.1 hypothetical protein PFNF135_02028 [Plasmodium falciparum NF135/5.C10]ETW57034.1 hypothetical protein PFUGPA_01055 [Plasmodium falciparum Palo Alto/Uganda]
MRCCTVTTIICLFIIEIIFVNFINVQQYGFHYLITITFKIKMLSSQNKDTTFSFFILSTIME